MSAAVTPPKKLAVAIPSACMQSAVTSSLGCDHRALSAAHSAADGTVALQI
jgi:hypothetical protein